MYCSRCSTQINEDLNFCSTCGERVNKNELAQSSKKHTKTLDTLATIAICIGSAGMLFLVGLLSILLDKAIPLQMVVLLAGMYLAAWFGILYKILGQISKLVDANLEDRKYRKAEVTPPVQLANKITSQLEEHREPAASVTENTTRPLDKVPVKGN
ncbi:MAG: zinc ribbon domain-containing protein [Acidobacteriota bacterium]|nr:zinc ribbon domain-containing protein [Acidobacteriota bacterium]